MCVVALRTYDRDVSLPNSVLGAACDPGCQFGDEQDVILTRIQVLLQIFSDILRDIVRLKCCATFSFTDMPLNRATLFHQEMSCDI